MRICFVTLCGPLHVRPKPFRTGHGHVADRARHGPCSCLVHTVEGASGLVRCRLGWPGPLFRAVPISCRCTGQLLHRDPPGVLETDAVGKCWCLRANTSSSGDEDTLEHKLLERQIRG